MTLPSKLCYISTYINRHHIDKNFFENYIIVEVIKRVHKIKKDMKTPKIGLFNECSLTFISNSDIVN